MKSKFKYDGKSRPVNDTYTKRWFEIFGKKEEDELKESYKQSKINKKERDDKEE
jgi:hypothetical protein